MQVYGLARFEGGEENWNEAKSREKSSNPFHFWGCEKRPLMLYIIDSETRNIIILNTNNRLLLVIKDKRCALRAEIFFNISLELSDISGFLRFLA